MLYFDRVIKVINMRKIDKKVIVGMSQELYDALKKLAEEDCRSVPSCIRMALKEYVEKNEKPGPG